MTCVILAGGESRRMGRDKTQLIFGGETLLDRAARRFGAAFGEVLVSVRQPSECKWPTVVDEYKNCGPMAGLHAALKARPDGVFLAAADMPFASPALALRLIELGQGHEACVIEAGRTHPLFGWYSGAALKKAEALLSAGEYRMTTLLDSLDSRLVTADELSALDLKKLLKNVNTPEEFENIRGG